jgi:hypothetical protein
MRKMGEEVIVNYLKVLSWHLCGRTKENHENSSPIRIAGI